MICGGIIHRLLAARIQGEGGRSHDDHVVAQGATYLGWGLMSLIHIFNPEVVVLGGGMVALKDLLMEPAIALAREQVFPQDRQGLRFVYAALGDDMVVMGAAALALDARH